MKIKDYFKYRIFISVVFGLLGFWANFHAINFMQFPHLKVTILPGLIFPLLISLAWGWRYGLLSALTGGCQSMWWLWRDDGYGLLYAVPVFTFWVVWHGFWADYRNKHKHKWYHSMYIVEIAFRCVSVLGFYTIFRGLVSLNPPPWFPELTHNIVPYSWVNFVMIKHIVTAYVLLLLCDVFLHIGPVRSLFRLKVKEDPRDTTYVVSAFILFGLVLWVIQAVMDYFIFHAGEGTFLDILAVDVPPSSLFARNLYIIASIVAGLFLSSFLIKLRVKSTELQKSEEKHRRLTANLPQKIFHKDTKSVYVACNENYARGLGVASDEITGKTDFDFFSKDLAEKYRADDRRLMESGQTEAMEEAYVKDGQEFVVQTVKSPIVGDDGNVTGILGIFWDITERKLAEETLRQYERIISATDDHMSFLDRNYVYQAVNYAYLQGHQKERAEIVGHSVADLFGEDVFERIVKEKLDLCFAGEEIHYQSWFDLPGLGRRYMDVAYYPYIETDGTVLGVVVSARDITQCKRAEEDLKVAKEKAEHISEAKTEFLMNISHDIRTPMNVINGFNDLLMKTPLSKEQERFCAMIKRKGADLIHLIEDIIDISAVEKGSVRMYQGPFAVRELTQDIKETVEVLIGDKNIKFHCNVSKNVPEKLMGDLTRLKQILDNLCGNAVKYTKKGRIDFTISIGDEIFEDQTHVICFVVKDTGIGIPEDKMAHIFEPYARFYEVEKGKKDGVGMGLHIVQTLVKAMDGEIAVESQVGKGSKFSFCLKMTEPVGPTEEVEEVLADQSGREVDLSGISVLIAEDDEDNRVLMEQLLDDAEIDFKFACNGAEVIAEMKKRKYDLVLMDLRMPRMDGFETTQVIRKDIDKDIPIFALTAHVVDFVEDKCKEAGMNGYITKPVDIDKLKTLIHQHIGQG